MGWIKRSAALGFAACALSGVAQAEPPPGYVYGEETKGVTLRYWEDADMTIRLRLQPRLDIGDLYTNAKGDNVTESDFYLRRLRLDLGGHLVKNLTYSLTFSSDKAGKADKDANVAFGSENAYLNFRFANAFGLRFGKGKLPYSRIALTSSAKQLLIERPQSVEAAKKEFDDYFQPNLMVHGKFGGGVLQYQLAAADGSRYQQDNKTPVVAAGDINGNKVRSRPAVIARLVLSPHAWIEGEQSDAHLGGRFPGDKHLALGLDVGQQRGLAAIDGNIQYDRTLYGGDLSLHYGGFSAQAEYNTWTNTKTNAPDAVPAGWYVQAGYLISGIFVEPVARYEQYNRDTKAAAGPMDKLDRVAIAGLNWYLKGHSLKLGANWVGTRLGPGNAVTGGDTTTNVYQVQAQLYF